MQQTNFAPLCLVKVMALPSKFQPSLIAMHQLLQILKALATERTTQKRISLHSLINSGGLSQILHFFTS